MRKLIKLAVVALGIRAFMRWRKRRREQAATPAAAEPEADPADELRRKLAETRPDEDVADATEPPAAAVSDRRAEVHDQARVTLDEMKSSDES